MFQTKEEIFRKNPSDMETRNLPSKEFKVIFIKTLTKLSVNR